MEQDADSLKKQREIVFSTLHPDPDQAGSAAVLLLEMDGVSQTRAVDQVTVEVHYNLLVICLADIEDTLAKEGFHLDNRLVHKIRRALYHYTEDTQRANLGCARGESNCTRKVFASSYRKREHGCQDERPEHWRRYL